MHADPGALQPVAEIAEALEALPHHQLRHHIGKDVLAVFSVSDERRAVTVLMVRDDGAFVWRVTAARPMNGPEFDNWLRRTI